MSPDVITKFTYLEYGKHAPAHSSFKGIITTKSIIGFSNYGKRKESRELSDEAKAIIEQNKNFFNYTKERIGATKTYSSLGWIDTPDKDLEFRETIAEAFHKDGNIIWVPVLSLRDFMTSTEMKLFNEEDYAAVFDKILPVWFRRAGFENDNMIWWMDHHVNTDNPHIHFNFLEKKQTKTNGKISMKNINDFKSLFWKEVFSKKRYLEKIGKTVEAGFQSKDLLKQKTYKMFKEELRKCTDPEFIHHLKNLYNKLPSNGRLQYNSSHMLPYREELDQLVDILLRTESVNEHYTRFMRSINEFDEVRSKSLNSKYTSITTSEDKKLRVLLANTILHEYKNIDDDFCENQFINNSDIDIKLGSVDTTKQQRKYIPIANSLIKGHNADQFLVRVPGGGNHIYIDKSACTLISLYKKFYVAEISSVDIFDVFDCNGINQNQKLGFDDIQKLFANGEPYLNNFLDLEKNQQMKAALWQQREKEWAMNSYDWNKSYKNIKKISFAWMNEIEHKVDQARDEYLNGKEYDLS